MNDREAQAAREWVEYWRQVLATPGQSWMAIEDARRQLAHWRKVLRRHERGGAEQR